MLSVTACKSELPPTPTATQDTLPKSTTPTNHPVQLGTQVHVKTSPTSLPAIPATPNVSTPSPLGVTAGQLAGLQVRVWYPWEGAIGESFKAILDEFNRTNQYGVIVEGTAFEDFGSLDEAMEAALSSGSLPDIVVDYGFQARRWESRGAIVDLKPFVDDPVWGLDASEQTDFVSSFWSEDLLVTSSHPDTQRLGIPYYRSGYVLFYNQSWATELGYPNPPTSLEDFRMQACAAAESVATSGDKTKLGRGGWLVTPQPGSLIGWIYAFGGNVINPSGTGYLFNTTETNQAFTYLKNLQQSGCAWTDNQVDAQQEFANRQALFVVGSLFDISKQRTALAQAGSEDEWKVIAFPSDQQQVVATYGPSLLVTQSTTAEELASWLVIEWLVYPPKQAEFVQQMGVYPTRQSTLKYLLHTEQTGTQWAQALLFLPDGRGEPTLPSWNTLRWALSDASSELFSQQFGVDQIPTFIEKLDGIAQEIFSQVH